MNIDENKMFPLHFDIRAKIILLLEMNLMLFIGSGIGFECIIIVYCSIILLFTGNVKTVVHTDIVFIIMYCIEMLVSFININSFLVSLILFIVVILRRFIPIFMIGRLIFDTKISEFVACMWKMKLPKNFIISVSVVFRFFPTVKEEWQAILSSMRMRGIGFNFWNFITHPLLTLEYLIVPLLLNAVKISEELSEAALCRGLDCENEHTCLTEVRLRALDYLICLLPLFIILYIKYF